MNVWPDLFTVEGKYVAVVPLSYDHVDDLTEAAADGELYKLWYTMIPKPENVKKEIRVDLCDLRLNKFFFYPSGDFQGIYTQGKVALDDILLL